MVLVLAGLALALALPNLDRLYGATARATERDRILDRIAVLGREAAANGQAYVLTNSVSSEDPQDPQEEDQPAPPPDFAAYPSPDFVVYPLDLPQGWQVRVDEPILARATGVCLGGVVTLLHEDSAPRRITLTPPFCAVAPAAGRARRSP